MCALRSLNFQKFLKRTGNNVNHNDWNKHAAKFESTVCDIVTKETNNQFNKLVRAALKSRKNPVLVDMGCGVGSFVKKYQKKFSKIFALDFATRIVLRAKRRCARIAHAEWFAMDMTRAAKFFGPRADLTVSLNVVTMGSAKKREAAWKNIRGVTKPKGYALIVVPSIESQDVVDELGKEPDERTEGGLVKRDGAWQKFFSAEEFAAAMEGNGFKVKKLVKVHYPWSVEGLRKPRSTTREPWDWLCLAQRVA